MYALRLYRKGKPQSVVIDDFLPTQDEFPISMDAPLWAHLIEKARAKVHGGYEKSILKDDTRYSVYSELTGGKVLCLKTKEGQFDMVEKAKKAKHLVALRPKKNFGLSNNCDYSVVDTVKVRNGRFNQLCKIRIPTWVDFTWTGDWSMESEQWDPEARKVVGEDKIKTDGFFWMSWPDISKNFS